MRKILYPVVAILMLAVVTVDHYTVNSYLNEFEEARNYNLVEMVQAYQMQDVVLFAQGLQETLILTNRRLEKSENRVIEYQAYIQQLKDTNARQEAVLLETVATIKELTDDNAQSQLEYERRSLANTVKELERVKNELETIKRN